MMMTMIGRWGRAGWPAWLMGALMTLAAGCGTTPADKAGPSPEQSADAPARVTSSSPDLVRLGDKVEIGFTDIPAEYPVMIKQVQEDGTITLPLGVKVVAAGEKAGDLQELIRQAYVPKYFTRLTVSVKVEERVFYVGGMVRNPGRFAFVGEMTVMGAIKVAGDFNEFAKKTTVRVTHADGTTILVDCKKALKNPKYDLPVFPGDKIDVDRKVIW